MPPSLLAALMGGQPPQMPQMASTTPVPPQPSLPQVARQSVIGMLGAPVEGQSQSAAIAPQPLPAKTLEDWGYDPRKAKGGS